MKIVNKKEMEKLINNNPDGGVVFSDYDSVTDETNVLVSDGIFGATELNPRVWGDGELFDFDWNVSEYRNDELFVVFEREDIVQMIELLERGLEINNGGLYE